MATTLHTAVTSVLKRLGDTRNQSWSRDEIALYVKDAYDSLVYETKCIFDLWVIENLPVTANWTSDLGRYIVEHTPGLSFTDRPFHTTGDFGKEYGSPYGGSLGQAAAGTNPGAVEQDVWDRTDLRADGQTLPNAVAGGDLPQYTVDLLSVRYDDRQLQPTSSTHLKSLDPNYEQRTGDPQWYTWDKDGIYFLRVIPVATGIAEYNLTSGSWGVLTQSLDADSAVVNTIADSGSGGWGAIAYRDTAFPAGGQWGAPTRSHPNSANIVAEISRLGRSLDSHPFEIPEAYLKYVYFFAASRALERVGPGQDLELAQHYLDRYTMGVERLRRKKQDLNKERVGAFGGSLGDERDFGLGDAQPPFPYGIPQ